MRNFKYQIFFLFLATSLQCKPQTDNKISFGKIIYHASRCNGSCPDFHLEIDSNRNVFVNRTYYKSKEETDSNYTGQFEEVLSQPAYDSLRELLKEVNLDSLKFPDIDCCDDVVQTLIVYYNGKRKYLKSMQPPPNAMDFLVFLRNIADDKTLQKSTKNIELER
jgi:hypothetical protein